MFSPKVLSLYNNAKIFLSEQEMKELQQCIAKDFGTDHLQPKKKPFAIEGWTLESVTEQLLATHFKSTQFKNNNVHKQQNAETP